MLYNEHMREKKNPEQKRTNILRVGLLASERELIDKAAQQMGLDSGTYCRVVALQAARSTPNMASIIKPLPTL
jgi:uncharacterized protein (DUF1778 family)